MKRIILFIAMFAGFSARSDISDTYRQANAVVLYRFNEGTGTTITDSSNGGNPLNLKISQTGGVSWLSGGGIEFSQNLIVSTQPAKKIYDACTASQEMSVEIWLQNNGTAQLFSGFYPDKVPQPLRIVAYSSGLNKSNFELGQFYDGTVKNEYMVGVETNNNTAPTAFLSNAVTTSANEIIVPTIDPNPNETSMQKVVFTLSKGQVASLYLSDRNGNMYLSQTTSNGFTSQDPTKYLSGWDPNAYLVLGNEYFSDLSKLSVNYQYNQCDKNLIATEPNCASPNRYWRGRVYLMAVYCKAVAKADVLGAAATDIQTNPSFDINLGQAIPAELKKASLIYSRLTGSRTPISNPVLSQMATLIAGGNATGAAALATNDAKFYNVVVRDFAAKMSNRAETIETPLNDFTATIIGAVRDNLNAQSLLTDNIVYQADPKLAAVPSDMVNDILKSNNHYAALENGLFDLSKVLVKTSQKLYNGTSVVDNPAPAGLLTTRQWMAAHAVAGTNRRMVEYTFREFLCSPIASVADPTGPDSVIGRDIDRFPGGSHSKFVTTCRACHTIMDGFRPAFANFTFNDNFVMNSLILSPVQSQADEDKGDGFFQSSAAGATFIHDKYNHNETVFPGGRITVDENWVNNANLGANATTFQWSATSGQGPKAFGQLIATSKQYPICLAKRVYSTICKRDPTASEDALINKAAQDFTAQSYNLRVLFQDIVVAPECLGSGT